MSRRCLVAGVAALATLPPLSGCVVIPAPEPPAACWSDPEQLGERTRFLPGVEEARALGAAERLLRLAGGKDAQVSRSAHEVTARISRDRTLFLLLYARQRVVHEQWAVATRPEADGSRVCVQVAGHYFAEYATPAGGVQDHILYPASAAEGKRPLFVAPPERHAVDYATFWARLEHLAGLRSDWAPCPSRALPAKIDPLCHPLANDPGPG